MPEIIRPVDLKFFVALGRSSSLTAAAQRLGLTTAAVSKRLLMMEKRAGVLLVDRTTRRMMLTPEGEVLLEHARRILGDIDHLSEFLGAARETPKGLLRVCATLGFGRKHVGPLIARFVNVYPQVSVQLQLSAVPPPLVDDPFDVCILFGEPPDARVIARRLSSNRRLLCASPDYVARRGIPSVPRDLLTHDCISIHQGEGAYDVWRLTRRHGGVQKLETVHISGNLATNDGETAVRWALAGQGVLMRAEWDIREYLDDGRLVTVLPEYETQSADIYAVYARRQQMSARVRAFVAFLVDALKSG
ncbi:MAG TPA: LysR family transcriptional regulator [Castellaniella sp.]|uniref:LysR family transcriptional regulator n=1 Tax=Castellaniella sp. TaxID=1955812 RepID=UPI002F10F0E5